MAGCYNIPELTCFFGSVSNSRQFKREEQGVVLQSYGTGNFPSNRNDLLKEFELAATHGVLIVNCTQCSQGSVSTAYKTGELLQEAGVLPGFDMTPEAALTKLSFVLGQDWDLEKKRQMIQLNLRGELTWSNKSTMAHHFLEAASKFEHWKEFLTLQKGFWFAATSDGCTEKSGGGGKDEETDGNISEELDVINRIIKIVAGSLNMTSTKEVNGIKKILGPSLTLAIVAQACESNFEVENLESLFQGAEAKILQGDIATLGRTPLHLACALNSVEMVEFLLGKGASVHTRDNRGYSALREAVDFDSHDVIPILVKCGAHFIEDSNHLGLQMALWAGEGNLKRVQSFHMARVNLNKFDSCGRTPLHSAVEGNQSCVVSWLIENGADTSIPNKFGLTPLKMAQHLNLVEIINLITKK